MTTLLLIVIALILTGIAYMVYVTAGPMLVELRDLKELIENDLD